MKFLGWLLAAGFVLLVLAVYLVIWFWRNLVEPPNREYGEYDDEGYSDDEW